MADFDYIKLVVLDNHGVEELWCFHLEETIVRINGNEYRAGQWTRKHQIKEGIEGDNLIVEPEMVS